MSTFRRATRAEQGFERRTPCARTQSLRLGLALVSSSTLTGLTVFGIFIGTWWYYAMRQVTPERSAGEHEVTNRQQVLSKLGAEVGMCDRHEGLRPLA